MSDPIPQPRPKAAPRPRSASLPQVVAARRADAIPAETPPESTRAFTAADLAELRRLLAADTATAARTKRAAPPRHHPPNLGGGLTVAIVVLVLALAGVAVVFGYLLLR